MKGKVLKILKYIGVGLIGILIIGMIFGKSMADEITINEKDFTMDINQSQQLSLTIHPEDGLIYEDDFQCSDSNIIEIEDIKDGKLFLKSLNKEGNVTLQYKKDDVASNTITIQVVDQQAIAMAKAKEEEKKQAEEIKKQEEAKKIEEQKKADEKKKNEQEQKKTTQTATQRSSSQSNESSSTSSSSQSNHTNSAMVYIPRTGKKYHSNANCSNMKNPSQVSLSEAQNRGFTACKKCY